MSTRLYYSLPFDNDLRNYLRAFVTKFYSHEVYPDGLEVSLHNSHALVQEFMRGRGFIFAYKRRSGSEFTYKYIDTPFVSGCEHAIMEELYGVGNIPELVCDRCGSPVSELTEYDGESMCQECVDHLDRQEPIKNYSYKPNPVFRGTGDFHMGVELEVVVRENTSEIAYQITKQNKHLFYCKNDSSIGGGIEIVSHPFTLEYEIENESCKAMIEQVDAYRETRAGRRDDVTTCGMHVHVSRNVATPDVMVKVARFFVKNVDFIFSLSNRVSREQVDRYARINMSERQVEAISTGNYSNSSHYCAIHCTRNTYEFRIFNSTLEYDEFMCNLEFVHAVISYFKERVSPRYAPEKFLAWVSTRNYNRLESKVCVLLQS